MDLGRLRLGRAFVTCANSLRGRPFSYNEAEETADNIIKASLPSPSASPPASPPASPWPSLDQYHFRFFGDGLSRFDRTRWYSRIDSLRCRVLDIHLKKASRHDYDLRSLA
jgi:hypothetical protein